PSAWQQPAPASAVGLGMTAICRATLAYRDRTASRTSLIGLGLLPIDGCDGWILAQPIDICRWIAYNQGVAVKELPVVRQRGVCCGLPDVDEAWADRTATLMKALADPTRLTMVASLWKAEGPICICDFTAGLDLSQPTPSHHMGKLKDAGLVESEKRGIWMYYRLASDLDPATRRLLGRLIA